MTKSLFFSAIFVTILFLLNACAPKAVRENIVVTGTIGNATGTTAQANGLVLDLMGNADEHGHVWSEFPQPTLQVSQGQSTLGFLMERGEYQSQLTGLSPQTTYYIRGYMIVEGALIYGKQVSFSTTESLNGEKPEVFLNTTGVAVKPTTAQAFASLGNATATTFTEHGHVWSTASNPTVETASNTQLGLVPATNPHPWESSLNALQPGTTYFVRAYVSDNSGNTTYGNEVQFTTPRE